MSHVNVLVWGLGAMGLGVSEIIQGKSSLNIVAAVTRSPSKVGRDLGSLTNTSPTGIIVTDNIDEAFDKKPDVALICTTSFVTQVAPQIIHALNRGSNVITIAEEMAYPWISSPELSKEIHEVALANGKTVLGTGINPGFVLDILIITMTGVCKRVDHILGRRVNDLAPFGPTVMRTQGVGTSPEEFEKGLASGEIVGHVGFPQSVALIASALGWTIDKVEEERQPITSKVERKTEYAHVMPGDVAGCRHVARAYSGGREVILLEHPQQIRPELEGIDTGDSIFIKGDPNINLNIRPEIPGGIGTTALAVNMIPQVVNACPGLLSMADFQVPRLVL